MKIENLRSLIKESIQEYISEVEESGNIAAQQAKVNACDEAIANRMKKINMEGLDEAYFDMMSEEKMKELKAEVKALENYKKKATKILEKLLEKKENKGKPKAKKEEEEVVTDAVTEDVPVDKTDVLANMSEESAEETAINESFLKMQKLAGVITEAQYNEKKRLIENQLNEEEKTIQAFGPRLMDGLKQNGFEVKMTTNSQDSNKMGEFIKTSDKKLAGIFYDAGSKFIRVTTNRDNQDDAFKAIDSPFVKELLPDGFRFDKQGSYFIELQGS
jgi:hypothetical protein